MYSDAEMNGETYFLGVDIGGTNLRIALANEAGTILARELATTKDIRDAGLVVAAIRDGAARLLQQTGITMSQVKAIGAGAPGITNASTGVVIATSYLMGWRDVSLAAMLQTELEIPAAVDNDVNLAALGESCFGAARGVADFVFIALGTGVGAGIMLRGELFQGAQWTAGEIGYMLVPGVSTEPIDIGKPGALESIAGGEGIRTQWQAVWNSSLTGLSRDLTATEVFDGALDGDSLAVSILERTAHTLAYAIFNLALTLNASVFILGGSVGMHPALRDRVQVILDLHSRRLRPQLILSDLGGDAQILGAIRLAQLTALNS